MLFCKRVSVIPTGDRDSLERKNGLISRAHPGSAP